jgi:minor histocompatibility antigen H13
MEQVLTKEQALTYGAILTMAITPIYIGSHLSLKQKVVETMSTSDAWKFPFIGSGVLFGLYMLFKLFSKEYINMLLTAYFLCFGILAVWATIKPVFIPIFGGSTGNETDQGNKNSTNSNNKKLWKWSFTPFWSNEPIHIDWDVSDVVSLLVSIGIGVWYVMTKHWISNNILGLSFSVQGIALLSLGSYKVGAILLGGLFFYDIFWVFGTDVMVTVAKSFDAPIKLLFPKDLFAETLQFSMLGLGDIVIPGVFIALLLRFDAKRAANKRMFSKTYFLTCYFAYILGLVTTVAVMHLFQAAQPALLYLVPACLGSSFLLATVRGEVGELLAYNEESEHKSNNNTNDSTTTTTTTTSTSTSNSNPPTKEEKKAK